MPYPSIPDYGANYGTNQGQPSSNSYSSARGVSTNPYGPVTTFANGRQSHSATPAYGDQGHVRSNYAQSNQPTYGREYWRDGSTQKEQYGYMRNSSSYDTQAAPGNIAYSKNVREARSNNLSGLNDLAYASGLDSHQSSNRSRQAAAATSNHSTGPATTINRTGSPMQGMHQQQPSAFSTLSPGLYQQPQPLGNCSRPPSVAEALAAAMDRKHQQNATHRHPQAPQRSASPYVAPPTNRQAPFLQNQHTISSPTMSQQAALADATRNPEGISSRQPQSASQPASISNLVTAQSPVTSTSSFQDAMPAYIDPSQVFNPYQREHEQRRRAAAEAAARRVQEEAQRKELEAQKRTEEEAAAKAAAAAAEAAKTETVQKKAQEKTTPKAKNAAANSSAPTPTTASASPPADDDMATQMKFMMDKMKQYRQQDPATFQKLWEDMRKGGGSSSATTGSATAPSASPQIAQKALLQPQASQAVAVSTPQPQPAAPVEPSAPTSASKRREPRPPPQHPAGIDTTVPLNGYKVVVEQNEEGLPDLGRFPAERRIRSSYHSRLPAEKAESPSKVPIPPGLVTTQPLPSRGGGGEVDWPKDKREALAKSAIGALKADKSNDAIAITTEDITAMLDQNPNYIDLCDLLEKRGLKFHRGQFARQLLASVPELTKVQKPEPPPPTMGHPPPPPLMPPAGMHYPPVPIPQHSPAGQPPAGMTTQGLLFQGPYMPPQLKQEVKRSHKRKSLPLAKPEPPPGSKEAMARKHNFSELVDLTQLSDNDDYVLSAEQPRLGSPTPEPDLFHRFQFNGTPQQSQTGPVASFLPGPRNVAYPPSQHVLPSPTPQQPPKRPKLILARAVNKSEALAKEWYDPKTVARDIMIAAGRHPTERPLNAHMAGLLGVHIELDSDLNTFDWDAIDPGGPPAPKVAYVDILAGPPRYRLGDRVHKRRDREAPRQPGEARHPRLPDADKRVSGDPPSISTPAPAPTPALTSPALFALLNHRTNQRKEDKDHNTPGPSKLRDTFSNIPKENVTLGKRKANADPSDAPAPHTAPGAASPVPTRSEPRAPSMDSTATPLFPSGKRRGRPPGAKNKQSRATAMLTVARPAQSIPQVLIPVALPSPQAHLVFKCKWVRCKDELHNLETLRNHIRRKHSPFAEELNQDKPFACWWKFCPTRGDDGIYLPSHAYETVDEWMEHVNQTHVHEVALKLGDGPKTTPVGKQESPPHERRKVASSPEVEGSGAPSIQVPPTRPTSTNARMLSHADPQALEAAKTRFLSDARGRTTTPSLTPEQNEDLPPDTWVITSLVTRKEDKKHDMYPDHVNGTDIDANVQAQKAFLKTHRPRGERGAVGAKVAAEETLKAMETYKKNVGVGLDRGGCTLVNEARRSTFVHAPGIRTVVEADY